MRDGVSAPGPPGWYATRHCPTCASTSLVVSSDEVELDRWCTIACAACGRELRREFVGAPSWEDPEWVKAGEQ